MLTANNELHGQLSGNGNIHGGGIAVKGDTGNGIEKIEKTGSVGLVDTYTIFYTDETTETYTVTNGAQGPQGVPGYTPVKGVDYFTESEVNEIISEASYDDTQVKSDITSLQTNKANKNEIPDVSNFITKDVNNLTYYTLKTSTGSLIDLEINSSTYVVTLKLKDVDGNVISTDTIDLPLETVVVGGSYDSVNKKVVLTLENGNTVEFSVADLVAGLQSEITSSNKLASDLVDDTNSGNKFVTTSEKTTWNGKQDHLTAGTGIDITNNVISNTQTSAEWGNISGTLSDQTDLNTVLSGKQANLVSGTNIKTINNNSLLGSGNLSIQSGETLPVGTEFDYDGQTVPVGYEEVDDAIESGSNANGYYVKYNDGTMICTKSVGNTTDTVSSWGALYDTSFDAGNWAETFISTPIVNATIVSASGFVEGIRNTSTTAVGSITIARPTNISSANPWAVTLNVIGIGRWK